MESADFGNVTGLHGSRARPAPVLFLGLQSRGGQQAASFLRLCQAQRKLGRLACSAHTVPGPHLPHTSGAAVGRHICCLSLHCQGALVVAAAAAAVSGLVPRLRDFKSSTVPVLCPQKERLKDLFLAMELAPLRPAFGQTAAALLWAYCKCLHWCLAGISLQASGKGCWSVPWVWMDYSPKRQRGSFDPGSTESLGAPFPSVGATSISSPLHHCLLPHLVLCPEPSLFFHQFLELGSSALCARTPDFQDTGAGARAQPPRPGLPTPASCLWGCQ